MKKTIIAALLLGSPLVLADNMYGTVEYDYYDYKDSAETHGAALVFGGQVLPTTVIELRTEYADVVSSDASATQAEIAGVQKMALTDTVGVYGRVAVGNQWVEDADDFEYFSVEPGVSLAINGVAGLRIGYRYLDSFDNDLSVQTDTVRIGVDYSIANNSAISVGYDHGEGDSKFESVSVGYTYSF